MLSEVDGDYSSATFSWLKNEEHIEKMFATIEEIKAKVTNWTEGYNKMSISQMFCGVELMLV